MARQRRRRVPMDGEDPVARRELESRLFAGLRFCIESARVQEDIETCGGTVVAVGAYDPTCTHVQTSVKQGELYANAVRDGKAVVTEHWLGDCMRDGTVHNARSKLLYQPPADEYSIPGMDRLSICVTGYKGNIRQELRHLVNLTGAAYTGALSRDNTHLVCFEFEGPKYDKARDWGVAVVNHLWLEACVREWRLVPHQLFDNECGRDAMARLEREAATVSSSTRDEEQDKDGEVADGGEAGTRDDQGGVEAGGREMAQAVAEDPGIEESSAGGPPSDPIDADATQLDEIPAPLAPASAATLRSRTAGPVAAGAKAPAPDTSARCAHSERAHTASDGVEGDDNGRNTLRGSASAVTSCPIEPADAPPASAERQRAVRNARANRPGVEGRGGAASQRVGRVVAERENIPAEDGGDGGQRRASTARQQRAVGPLHEANGCAEAPAYVVSPTVPLGAGATKSATKAAEAVANRAAEEHTPQGRAGSSRRRASGPASATGKGSLPIVSGNTPVAAAAGVTPPSPPPPPALVEISSAAAEAEVSPSGVQELAVDNLTPPSKDRMLSRKAKDRRPVARMHVAQRGMAAGQRSPAVVGAQAAAEGPPHRERHRDGRKAVVSSSPPGREVVVDVVGDDGDDAPALAARESEGVPKRYGNGELSGRGLMGKKKKRKGGLEEHSDVEDPPSNGRAGKAARVPRDRRAAPQGAVLVASPAWLALGGTPAERTAFVRAVAKLKGIKVCPPEGHEWDRRTTHLVLPPPLRRTEKSFAAAAAGCWVVRPSFVDACREARGLAAEDEHEWGPAEGDDGAGGGVGSQALALEAFGFWRRRRQATGSRAFEGMKMVLFGDFLTPPSKDTLVRAVHAGGGRVLAHTVGYPEALALGVDLAVLDGATLRGDADVAAFLAHGVGCVSPDYLLSWVCTPQRPRAEFVLFGTHAEVAAVEEKFFPLSVL